MQEPLETMSQMYDPKNQFGTIMSARDVLRILDQLTQVGIETWIDGGWGVDALLGTEHRNHRDLDLVMCLADTERAVKSLGSLGFAVVEDQLPTRLVLWDDRDRQIDVHPVTFDETGTGWQVGAASNGGDCPYSRKDLVHGSIAGRRVGCLSGELQLQHHRGYEPDERDRHDVALLARRFSPVPPDEYL